MEDNYRTMYESLLHYAGMLDREWFNRLIGIAQGMAIGSGNHGK